MWERHDPKKSGIPINPCFIEHTYNKEGCCVVIKNKNNVYQSKDWLTEIRGTDDYIMKNLSAFNKGLLPKILQKLRGYSEGEVITQSQDLDKELSAPEISEKKLKKVLLDKLIQVTVTCPSGDSYTELINFEAQNWDYPLIAKRFWGYGSFMLTHHASQGEKLSEMLSVVSIVTAKDRFSFLKGHDGYEEVFYPTGYYSKVRIGGHTLIIYELGKFRLSFEELKTDKEKILYIMKHFGTLTRQQMDKLRETGGVVEEFVDTLEKVVKHPKFGEGYNKWRSINRDTQGAINYAAEKGREEGRVEGREEGRHKAKVEIAITLLKKGDSVAEVSQTTGLSGKQVSLLKKNLV